MGQNPDIRELFRFHYRPLCLYALHYLKDADAVEDVVQEAFTAWWQKGDVADNAKAYLYAIVRNRCIDILRRQGRQPEQLQPEDAAGAISDEEAVDRSALEARLWEAVDRLPAKRRELLLMSKRDGLSYRSHRPVRQHRPQPDQPGASKPAQQRGQHPGFHPVIPHSSAGLIFFSRQMVLFSESCVIGAETIPK